MTRRWIQEHSGNVFDYLQDLFQYGWEAKEKAMFNLGFWQRGMGEMKVALTETDNGGGWAGFCVQEERDELGMHIWRGSVYGASK